jgi:hypothetical protein
MHHISVKQFAEAILISMISLSECCNVPSQPQALDLCLLTGAYLDADVPMGFKV